MPTILEQLNDALNSRERRGIKRSIPAPSAPSTESNLIDFNSNDYLSLSRCPQLRKKFFAKLGNAPDILGSGGSRLLVNGRAHQDFEDRLCEFFEGPSALLFNSGFDANVGFFSTIPQPGDVVVYDEAIHASVHDGIRASRAREAQHSFSHNSVPALRSILTRLRNVEANVFIAVESLYSMDGTLAPLPEMVATINELFPRGNAHLIVDEAHATGIYGPNGRGLVSHYRLEKKVFARLHTFGKALAATGAVIITHSVVREFLVNYARPLVYTTALSYANIILAGCSFDALEDGSALKLAAALLDLSVYFVENVRPLLADIPPDILSLPDHLQQQSLSPATLANDHDATAVHSTLLPTPIIPVLTAHSKSLSAFLLGRGMNARSITWPTVPKGKDRIRVCLHSGNSYDDVDQLIADLVEWARVTVDGRASERLRVRSVLKEGATEVLVESKL